MTVSVVLIPLQLMLIVVGAVFAIITQCCGCKKKKADEAQPDADQQQGTASTPLTTAEVQNTAYQTLAQGQPPFTAALGTISQRPSPAEPSPTSVACATNYALSDPNAISMKEGSPPSQTTTKMSSREPSIGATNYALDSPTGPAKTPLRESASFKGGGMHGAVSQRSSHGTMNATNYAMT
uniref:Uncharacterized protein n=1 Tax=Globodera pallida TaxID=36090 RepID=A0A183CI94_GLOPA